MRCTSALGKTERKAQPSTYTADSSSCRRWKRKSAGVAVAFRRDSAAADRRHPQRLKILTAQRALHQPRTPVDMLSTGWERSRRLQRAASPATPTTIRPKLPPRNALASVYMFRTSLRQRRAMKKRFTGQETNMKASQGVNPKPRLALSQTGKSAAAPSRTRGGKPRGGGGGSPLPGDPSPGGSTCPPPP